MECRGANGAPGAPPGPDHHNAVLANTITASAVLDFERLFPANKVIILALWPLRGVRGVRGVVARVSIPPAS
jgi:hypothetical protein